MLAARNARFTEEEFLALPETMDHVELIDGEVILSPSPLPVHQLVLAGLAYEFERWARAHRPATVGQSPLDVRFGPARILQPDLMIFRDRIDPRRLPVTTLPALVVEVLSSQRSYDRMTKRLVYAEAGVPEYWLVDLDDRTVEIVLGLETVEVTAGVAVSRAFTDLRVSLPEVFAEAEAG